MLRTAITSIFLISRGTQAARGYLPANLPATWGRDSRGYVRLVGGIPHAPDSPPATPTLPPTASRKRNNSSCPPFLDRHLARAARAPDRLSVGDGFGDRRFVGRHNGPNPGCGGLVLANDEISLPARRPHPPPKAIHRSAPGPLEPEFFSVCGAKRDDGGLSVAQSDV